MNGQYPFDENGNPLPPSQMRSGGYSDPNFGADAPDDQGPAPGGAPPYITATCVLMKRTELKSWDM